VVEAAVSDARTEVLARVAQAIAGAQHIEAPRTYRRAGSLEAEQRTQLFCSRVGDYRADVTRLPASEVETAVAALCSTLGVRTLVIPPPLSWRPAGVELIEDRGLTTAQLDGVDGAFTGCTAAVAETGTIILTGSPQEGRRALTLVPDLHICVVEMARIHELLPEALAVIGERGLTSRPITFISGPSATSDIELSRVEGVHGPRHLVVLVAEEAT
jgi:L-lactate dehydrogenase complex protein LldG